MKMKHVVAIVLCAVAIGGVTVAGIFVNNELLRSQEAISRLEKEVETANGRIEDAEADVKISKEEAKSARAMAREYKKELELSTSDDNQSEESEPASATTSTPVEISTPEPTVVITPTPEPQNAVCDFDYAGTYQGQGRTIVITHADNGAYYVAVSDDVPGAHGRSMLDMAGQISSDGCSLICSGTSIIEVNGVFEESGQVSVTVFHDGTNIYYNAGGDYNYGPFTKVG